jgi:hypothetical protein
MPGTTMCCIAYRIDDVVYPIPVLAHVWQWQGRQACVSAYRGKLEYAGNQAES